MKSKAIKPEFGEEPPMKDEPTWKLKLRSWWYDFFLYRWYSNVDVFIRRFKRVVKWGRFMWTNWDFDAATIFPLLERKLLRIQHCLINGHAIQEDKDLKALRVAIKLANRLSNDYHERKYYDWHERKWGDSVFWFTDTEDKNYKRWNSRRTKVKTKEDEEQEVTDLRKIWEKSPKWEDRDVKWLFAIIAKYYRVWWD